jgi:hypothetical protein
MKFKGYVIVCSSLWVEGMAVYPFIFLRTRPPGKVLLYHETIHLRQQLEMGFIPFYLWYFIEYAIRLMHYKNHHLAYLNISFEREAYANEREFEYLVHRKFWAFLKYL